MKRNSLFKGALFYLSILVMVALMVSTISKISDQSKVQDTVDTASIEVFKELSTEDFAESIKNGSIVEILHNEQSKFIYGKGDDEIYKSDNSIENLFELSLIGGIEVSTIPDSLMVIKETNPLTTLFKMTLLVLLVVVIFRSIYLFSKSKEVEKNKRINSREDYNRESNSSKEKQQEVSMTVATKIPDITFDDVEGCNELKKEAKSVIQFLQNPKAYSKMGARMPKGIVLYGPPGTGKTLTAKAMAGTAGVPFFSVSGSDFMEMYVGVGAKRVRELYALAKKEAPCIVFIDEFDAVGTKRGQSNNSERDQTINALLTELDGFSGTEGVLTVVATNRLDMLDSALIRPGRFDKHLAVPLPERADRLAILKVHLRNKKLSKRVLLEEIASKTVGFSGASLESLLNEATILAVDDGSNEIMQSHIDEAFFKATMKGTKKENQSLRDKDELKIVAYHEAGHALATKLLTKDKVSNVTIISSTSGAGGVTFRTPEEASLHSKEYLRNLVKVMYAGRVAELIYFGDEDKVTTGASQDIKQATNIIKEYIGVYGMGSLGMLDLSAFDIDNKMIMIEASKMSKELYQETTDFLNENKETLIEIAEALLEKESLNDYDLDEIIYREELVIINN